MQTHIDFMTYFVDLNRAVIDYIDNKKQERYKAKLKAATKALNDIAKDNKELFMQFVSDNDSQFMVLYHYITSQPRSRGDKLLKDVVGIYSTFGIETTVIATKILNEFIKGITLFKNEITELNAIHNRPIYHRLASCGEDVKDPNVNPITCFIERSIFDKIFNKYMLNFQNETEAEKNALDKTNDPVSAYDDSFLEAKQNERHLYYLSVVKTLALQKSCFNKIEIFVDQFLSYQRLPTTVTIRFIKDEDRDYIEHTYIKKPIFDTGDSIRYEDEVKCYKKKVSNGVTEYFTKTQSYQTKTEWIRVESFGGNMKKSRKSLKGKLQKATPKKNKPIKGRTQYASQ